MAPYPEDPYKKPPAKKKPTVVAAPAPRVVGKTTPVSSAPVYTPVTFNPGDAFAEAQARAKAMADPLLALLTKQQAQDTTGVQNQGEQWQSDINALYDRARPQIEGAYNENIAANTSVENAISKMLGNSGAVEGASLQKELEAIGAPGTAQDIEGLKGLYGGAAGAGFTMGMSGVENLINNKAGAQEWLTKQQLIDKQDASRQTMAAVSEIAKQYGTSRDEILAKMPEQVNALYDTLFNQNQAKTTQALNEYQAKTGQYQWEQEFEQNKKDTATKVALDKRDFNYKKKQDIIAEMDARHKLALETKLTAQQTMSEKAYKVWAKKFDANQRALDRQSRQQMNDADNQAKAASKVGSIKLTGPSSQKWITVTGPDGLPTVIANPNYVAPAKKTPNSSSKDTVDTAGSAKRARAYDKALGVVFNTDTGLVRSVIANAKDPDMKALHLINSALKGMGVDPYSKAGNQIRQSLWSFLDGKRTASGGVFVDPRKGNKAFQPKKKKRTGGK